MLEQKFSKFRKEIIGIDQCFRSPFGIKKIHYADWTASGRLYAPIEKILQKNFGPFVANTHTETTVTGSSMTMAYHHAGQIIKDHVGANEHDVLIKANSGMTGVVNKLQRILGLRVHEKYRDNIIDNLKENERPIVFITHMEHHSNQTTWLETICEVEVIEPDKNGRVCLKNFAQLLEKYKDRKTKIAAITSCSNVTGIFTPYHQMAAMIHAYDGWCFVDFACSAPYININMHPENKAEKLDAIYFSPHKFLGGPGSSGILIFCSSLYNNKVPDNPGGGTVDWTNPWGGHKYSDEIELREDGGTPAFLQTIKVALSMKLKDEMGVENIRQREEEILEKIWEKLDPVENIHILANHIKQRLPVISFYIDDLHFNLAVKMLNDKCGIQVRGGCSCAGTYGHYLLAVSKQQSKQITDSINCGIYKDKPGWIRMSFHPTMTDEEVDYILDCVLALAKEHQELEKEYEYLWEKNEWKHKMDSNDLNNMVTNWFDLNTDFKKNKITT